MGIKGLNHVFIHSNVQTLCPHVKYRAKTIAIDANILIYRFCSLYMNNMCMFLECFMYKITSFLKYGIVPIFIFDGPPPHEKKNTVLRRQTTKTKFRERLECLRKIPHKSRYMQTQIQQLERQTFVMTKFHKACFTQLLEHLKLPYFIAEGEAEALCALLQQSKIVDYTLSDDTDTYAYGCSHVLHIYRNSERYLVETNLETFLKSKDLTRDEFLNACVLSGCDYIERVPNLNLEKCIATVRIHKTLESCINVLSKTYKMYTLEQYEHVKNIYLFSTTDSEPLLEQSNNAQTIIRDRLQIFYTLWNTKNMLNGSFTTALSLTNVEDPLKSLYIFLSEHNMPKHMFRQIWKTFQNGIRDFFHIRSMFSL